MVYMWRLMMIYWMEIVHYLKQLNSGCLGYLNNNVFTNHIEALITKNVIESERIEFKLDSPKPMFETNSDNIYFLSILPIHLQFKTDDNNPRPESRLELRPEYNLP